MSWSCSRANQKAYLYEQCKRFELMIIHVSKLIQASGEVCNCENYARKCKVPIHFFSRAQETLRVIYPHLNKQASVLSKCWKFELANINLNVRTGNATNKYDKVLFEKSVLL